MPLSKNKGFLIFTKVECEKNGWMGCWSWRNTGLSTKLKKDPSQKLAAEWLVEVYTRITGQIGRNAQKKKGLNGFKTKN